MENNQENTEVATMKPDSSSSSETKLVNRVSFGKETAPIFLKRNREKRPIDEQDALEGFEIYNGLERRFVCSASKVLYVTDTEDFLLREDGETKNHCTENEIPSRASLEREISRSECYRRRFRSL